MLQTALSISHLFQMIFIIKEFTKNYVQPPASLLICMESPLPIRQHVYGVIKYPAKNKISTLDITLIVML